MGASQSKEVLEAQRGKQKLVKPRTGSGSSPALLNVNSFSSNSLRFSSARLNAPLPERPASPVRSPVVKYVPPGAVVPDKKSPQEPQDVDAMEGDRRRRSLFRSKSSQDPEAESEKRSSSIGASLARRLGRTNSTTSSRTNSMTYESALQSFYGGQVSENRPVAVSRASWAYNMTSYEAKRFLVADESPVVGQRDWAQEEHVDIVRRRESVSPTQATPLSATAPIGRVNSDVSLYVPARRRSVIQTPGVATRARDAAGASRVGLHLSQTMRLSQTPTPSLSRQPSFDFETERMLFAAPPRITDPDAVPRVVTPCDADYRSIGAFKLGSLRIANGDASPGSPKLQRARLATTDASPSRFGGTQDYFSSNKVAVDERPQGETSRASPGAAERMPQPDLVPDEERASLSDAGLGAVQPSFSTGPSPSATDSNSILEHLPEIQLTPFSIDDFVPPAPRLEPTSKTSALDDQLFDDDAAAISAPEILAVRRDSNAKSDLSESPNSSITSAGNMTRTDSGIVTSPVSDTSFRTLAKADSGYSSNVSLRSFRSANQAAKAKESMGPSLDRLAQKESLQRPSIASIDAQQLNPMVMMVTDQVSNPAAYPSSPPIPPKNSFASDHTEERSPVIGPQHPRNRASRYSLPVLPRNSAPAPVPIYTAEASLDSTPRTPGSIPLTPMSTKSDGSASALSIGSASSRPSNLLQRLISGSRRYSSGPPAVHAIHEFDWAKIPSVPREIEAKLHQHTGMYPITTKRLALRTQGSKDTLRTIFSVGSLEISKDDLVAPLPPLPDGAFEPAPPAEPTAQQRPRLSSSVPAVSSPGVFQIPRKPVPRKPLPPAPEQTIVIDDPVSRSSSAEDALLAQESELEMYARVNAALGKNPYDAALAAMAGREYPKTRTMSMTAQLERNLALETLSGRAISQSPQLQSPVSPVSPVSPALPSPAVSPIVKNSRSPPPVSMRTRRSWNPRPPAPRRPNSTPVGFAGRPIIQDPNMDRSRGYPVVQGMNLGPESFGRDGLPPPFPPLHPRQPVEFEPYADPAPAFQAPRPRVTRTPSWEVQTDHDAPRRPSGDLRCNSMSAVPMPIPRPMSVQPPSPQLNPMRLLHRSSFDGFDSRPMYNASPQPAQNDGAQNPWNQTSGHKDLSVLPYDPNAFEWSAGGRYPTPAGRKPFRHSMGGPNPTPQNPPYRILHSYNSPAYRNVPIWS